MAALLGLAELESGLRELAARVRAAGIGGVRMFIVGGAALRLGYFDRPATFDIDARIEPKAVLAPFVADIAVERGWPLDWLNDDAAKFIPGYGKTVEWVPLHDDATISIWLAPADALLAMKLKAMEGRRGRDERDVAYLLAINGIRRSEDAEELLEEFFPGDALNEAAAGRLERIFAAGLPEIEPVRGSALDL